MFFKGTWNFQSIWAWFGNIIRKMKIRFSSNVFTNIFLLPSWNLKKWKSLARSPKLFAQNLRNFLDMVFISSYVKRKKLWHGTINNRSRNVRMAPVRYFQFHRDCKQPRFEAKSRMSNCEFYFRLFSEITYMQCR